MKKKLASARWPSTLVLTVALTPACGGDEAASAPSGSSTTSPNAQDPNTVVTQERQDPDAAAMRGSSDASGSAALLGPA